MHLLVTVEVPGGAPSCYDGIMTYSGKFYHSVLFAFVPFTDEVQNVHYIFVELFFCGLVYKGYLIS